jgi:hypothetical protein
MVGFPLFFLAVFSCKDSVGLEGLTLVFKQQILGGKMEPSFSLLPAPLLSFPSIIQMVVYDTLGSFPP